MVSIAGGGLEGPQAAELTRHFGEALGEVRSQSLRQASAPDAKTSGANLTGVLVQDVYGMCQPVPFGENHFFGAVYALESDGQRALHGSKRYTSRNAPFSFVLKRSALPR